jgi:hypothetical protein
MPPSGHRDQVVAQDVLGLADLVGVGGDAGGGDQALVEQRLEPADRLVVRHVRVGPVMLVEVDPPDPEPAQGA